MSSTVDGALLLTSELVDFLSSPVSIKAGSCSQDLTPSVTHVRGCRIDRARGEICIFVSQSHSAAVLQDLRGGGALSVVFSRPSTHRTVQFKASTVHIEDLAPGDQELITRHGLRVAGELISLGYNPAFSHALMAPDVSDAVCVRFKPLAAFDQTPGAGAGNPLGVC